MNPDRWVQVKQIYHSALELQPGRREEFLREACAGDASLLKEVTSLLAQDRNPDGLLELPALKVVAKALGEDKADKAPLAGRTLLHYRIEEKIGQGGMGEVYRARDTSLDRTVALKILPKEMQQDETARKRFLREARSAAALDHPFICHIHEIGEIDGMAFIVMEYVEGETLDQRLAKGPLPLKEALEKARELAEALEVAHKRSIVHRDLKPSNIMFTGEGHVKVMDFGLAKRLAFAEDAGSRKQTVSASLTETGTTMGTLAYMSPEQLRGEAVDIRSDIFSFGVVLYEMLTGAHPFKKSQAMETGHAILTEAPAPLAKYLNGPLILLQHALSKMLAKEPERRYQLIHEVKTDLEDLLPDGETNGLPLAEGESLVRPLKQPWRRGLPWVTAVGLLLIALWATRPTPFEPESARYLNVELSPGVRLVVDEATGPAADLSPDESMLAFVGRPEKAGERHRIYVRRLDQLEAMPLAGTEEVRHPVFSPDGQWIAFRAGRHLKKIPVNGGAVATLCQTGQTRGLDWSHDGGSIVFAPGAGDSGLSSVSSTGGIPHPLTRLEDGEVTHRWPQMLPGGKAVLFTAHSRLNQMNEASIVVQRIPGGERRTVLKGGYHARYLPSGHLAFINGASLFAVAFDPDTLEMKGLPARVLENVSTSSEYGKAEFAFSEKGTLVYVPGTSSEWTLDWVDREGNREPLLSKPTRFRKFQISPNGQRVALEIFDGTQFDIWIYDWKRDTTSRLTFNPADDLSPVWSPGGGAIAFASNRGGTFNLYWKRTDGSGEAQRLTESSVPQYPESWHPGGRYLAFEELTAAYDIRILALEGNDDSGWSAGEVCTFLNTPVSEASPRFSPDGRWLAYTSYQGEILDLYIRPFPGPGGPLQISHGGISGDPVWSPHGMEIFYALNDQIYRVRYRVERDTLVADGPELEEGVRHPGGKFDFRTYDLHPDGRRFAVRASAAGERNPDRHHVVFIQNFFDHLREQVPSQ